MAYPRPNAVSTRLITAINPSIVNICGPPFRWRLGAWAPVQQFQSGGSITFEYSTSEHSVHKAHSEGLTVHHAFAPRVTSVRLIVSLICFGCKGLFYRGYYERKIVCHREQFVNICSRGLDKAKKFVLGAWILFLWQVNVDCKQILVFDRVVWEC